MEQVSLKPHDLVILLSISLKDKSWTMDEIANELNFAKSAVFRSLKRSSNAKLFLEKNRSINRNNLIEFINHGIRYCFAAKRLSLSTGIPTSFNHPDLKKKMSSKNSFPFVWPSAKYPLLMGESIPLLAPIRTLEKVYKENKELYLLISLADAIRIGNNREIEIARDMITKIILQDERPS